MKAVIKDRIENSKDELILWVDNDGDVNFQIGTITICVDQLTLKAALKFANQNIEPK